MMRCRDIIVPPIVGGAVFGLLVAAAFYGAAWGGTDALAVAQASPEDVVEDVFSAGRRSGLLWLAVGLAVTIGLRAVSVRLKPRPDGTGPKPGSRRAKLSIIVGGLAACLAAAIDMFATSRGMLPIYTAAGLAIAMYFGAGDDPPRGAKHVEAEAPT